MPITPLRGVLAWLRRRARRSLGSTPTAGYPSRRSRFAKPVAAYTIGSAFAEFQEAEKGTIARGMLADLVIMSDDGFSMPPAAIKHVRVLTTVVGGEVVHQRSP